MELAEILAPKIKERFQENLVTVNSQKNPFAILRSPSPEVGTVELYQYDLEIVVGLGMITRYNFDGLNSNATIQEKELFTEDVLNFLDQLVAGEIEFFGTSSTGGCRRASDKPRGFLSKLLFGKKTYTWFGSKP